MSVNCMVVSTMQRRVSVYWQMRLKCSTLNLFHWSQRDVRYRLSANPFCTAAKWI